MGWLIEANFRSFQPQKRQSLFVITLLKITRSRSLRVVVSSGRRKLLNIKKIVSNQAEEYLEAIYRLESKVGFARTMDLARELGVVPGSITNTCEFGKKRIGHP